MEKSVGYNDFPPNIALGRSIAEWRREKSRTLALVPARMMIAS